MINKIMSAYDGTIEQNTLPNGCTQLLFHPKAKRGLNSPSGEPQSTIPIDEWSRDCTYRIKVKNYMLKRSEEMDDFDFMAKFNNNVPMPLMYMVGEIDNETSGMVHMNLRADISFKGQLQTCMMCGKPITNPISQFFGLGPVCGGHGYTNPFDSDEELQEAVDTFKREVLGQMTWSGWVIKSAIVEKAIISQ